MMGMGDDLCSPCPTSKRLLSSWSLRFLRAKSRRSARSPSRLAIPIAARAVGSILAQHKRDCPSHRVVSFDGTVTEEQAQLLQAEGVPVKGGRVLSLTKFLFRDFGSEKPSRNSKRSKTPSERRCASSLIDRTIAPRAEWISSYVGTQGVAAYVRLELPSLTLIETHTLTQEVRFPYIPAIWHSASCQ
jgi:hypothetical protein